MCVCVCEFIRKKGFICMGCVSEEGRQNFGLGLGEIELL